MIRVGGPPALEHIGRVIITVGVALIAVGALVWGAGKLGFRGLPGDIWYRSQRVTFYFPVVTCLALSVLLTAAVWLWRWLHRG